MPAPGEHSKITEAERLFASGAGSGRVREELTKKGFTTSARTCERWKASYEKYRSCLKPVKLHGEVGRPLRLNDDEIHELVEFLICRPDSTLSHMKRFLRDRFDIDTSMATISRVLKVRNLTKERLRGIAEQRRGFFESQVTQQLQPDPPIVQVQWQQSPSNTIQPVLDEEKV